MNDLNRLFRLIFLTALLMSCTPKLNSANQGDTFLQNSGFEESDSEGLPVGWGIVPHLRDKGQAVVDMTFSHSGKYSFKLEPNKKNTSEGFGVFIMLDKDALNGKDITISGFAKTKGFTDNVGICLNTDKQNWISLPKDTKGKFVSFSKTFSLSRSIPKAGLLVLVGGVKGTLWLDDLVVFEKGRSVESKAAKSKKTDQNLGYTNLLENSGFEVKAANGLPAGWQIIPHHKEKGEASQDNKSAYTGSHSLKMSPNKKNDTEGFGVFKMFNVDDIHGKDVIIEGFVKAVGLGNNNATLVLKTDKANWLKLPNSTGGKFVPFNKTLSIADSIPEAGLLILVQGKKGNVWIDDLKVSVKTELSKSQKVGTTTRDQNKDILKETTTRSLGGLSETAAILFSSDRDTGTRRKEIYVMDVDGSNVTRITFTNKHHFITGIDHSRRYIVSSRAVEDTHKPRGLGDEDRRSLWVLDLETKKEICLNNLRYHAEGDSFSPDGQWIVFFMKRGDADQLDIYKIKCDGTELTRLTNTSTALESDPSWSYDGKKILFSFMDTQTSNPRFVLKTMDSNGRNIKTVYDGGKGVAIQGLWPEGCFDAHWSPDDKWIVFEEAVKDTGGNGGSGIWHIFKVKVDGSGIKDLSIAGRHSDRAEYLPSYSQDGKSIIFGSIYVAQNPRNSHNDIFIMDANSGYSKQLTNSPANDMFPVWIPRSK